MPGEVDDSSVPPTEPSAEPVNSTPSAQGVEGIARLLTSEMPEPQEHAITQALAEQADAKTKDSSGQTFNPGIHATNADGSPRLTTRGVYALKRGRKGNVASAGDAPASGNQRTTSKFVAPGSATPPSAAAQKAAAARAGGAGAANLLLMFAAGIGGEEWLARKEPDEKAMLEMAFGDYFEAKGFEDIPPGWALVAAVSMYALPRFTMPKTKSRMQRLKLWAASRYGAWRARRIAKRRGFPETDVEREVRGQKDWREEHAPA